MSRFFVAAFAAVMVLASSAMTNADPESCRNAMNQFSGAQSAVAAAVTPYSECIADSDGHDSCDGAFQTLLTAQTQLQSAVAAFNGSCD